MRFYLLDSAMVAPHGHHDHFARGFLKVAEGYDCEPVVCAHKGIKETLQKQLRARPTFTTSMYARLSTDPYDGPLTDFRMRTRTFIQDLGALAGAVSAEDVLLLPTANAAELHALGQWIQQNGVAPKVAAYFHRAEPGPLTPGALTPALLRTATRSIIEARPSGYWLGATNRKLGEALGSIMARPVHVAPSVTFYNDAPVLPPEPLEGRAIRVGFLGSGRGEKGADVIPELITAAAAADLPLRFVVQCHGYDRDLMERYHSLRQQPRVELLESWVTDEAMVSLVDSLDIVAMPYQRARYASMVSGVFTLAVGHGKPALVPSGTWMADQIESGDAVGVVYDGDDVNAVLDALRAMSADLAALSRRAGEAAPRWRRRFSGETMVRHLMHWAGVSSRPAAGPTADVASTRAGTGP
jgi:hypothetical protein